MNGGTAVPSRFPLARVELDDPARLAAVRRLMRVGDDNPVVARLSALAAHVLETSSAHVSLVDSATAVLGGHGHGERLAEGPPVPRGESLCSRIAGLGAPLVIHDAADEDAELRRLLGVGTEDAVGAYLGVPLVGSSGLPVGAVCVYDERPRDWSGRDVTVLEDLAEAVAAELERVAVEGERNEAQRMLHDIGHDHEQALVALIASASDILAASLEPEVAVRSLVRLTVPALADWSVVTLLEERGRLRDVEWWHRDPAALAATEEFARHRFDGLTELPEWLAAITDRGHYVLDSGVLEAARAMLGSERANAALEDLAPESMLIVPLAGRGRVDGAITLFRGAGRPALSAAETAAACDIGRRASVALGNARDFTRHRATSEELQRSMLTPPVVPPGAAIEVRYSPATEAVHVGGDWYDAFGLADSATMLVVGDVAGHDLAAAATMGQIRSMVRGLAVTTCTSPAVLLDEVDRALERLVMDVGATALVGRLRSRTTGRGAELSWASAGHPPALLLAPDGTTELLQGDGVMLGVGGAGLRSQYRVDLPPATTLLLFTDGLVERRHEGLDAGLARLRDVASALVDRPLPELVDRLLGEMIPGDHEDDVALLAVRLD